MANILVVDDEPDVVTLLKYILEKDGHCVQEACDGTDAIEKLGLSGEGVPPARPDLVILDVMMPNIDGYTVCRRMAGSESLSSIPFAHSDGEGPHEGALRIPARRGRLPGEALRPEEAARDGGLPAGRREIGVGTILVVDDEPEIVTLLRFVLEKDGHRILDAGNGLIALERLGVDPPGEAPRFDLIILDIMMPVMDGYALNSRLQREERTRSIPILVLTAKGQKMRDLFEMAPNVAAYVQKPFDPRMLRELIQGIVSGRKA
jgi:CheY-like chemotaxis protein